MCLSFAMDSLKEYVSGTLSQVVCKLLYQARGGVIEMYCEVYIHEYKSVGLHIRLILEDNAYNFIMLIIVFPRPMHKNNIVNNRDQTCCDSQKSVNLSV